MSAFCQDSIIFSICCSTGEFLLNFLKVTITAIICVAPLTQLLTPSKMRHTTHGRPRVRPQTGNGPSSTASAWSEQSHFVLLAVSPPSDIHFSLLHVHCCFVDTVWQVKFLGKSEDYEETKSTHQPNQTCPHHSLPMWLECTGKGPFSWNYSYLVINGQTSNGYVSYLWIWHKYLEHCTVLGTHKFPFVYS